MLLSLVLWFSPYLPLNYPTISQLKHIYFVCVRLVLCLSLGYFVPVRSYRLISSGDRLPGSVMLVASASPSLVISASPRVQRWTFGRVKIPLRGCLCTWTLVRKHCCLASLRTGTLISEMNMIYFLWWRNLLTLHDSSSLFFYSLSHLQIHTFNLVILHGNHYYSLPSLFNCEFQRYQTIRSCFILFYIHNYTWFI